MKKRTKELVDRIFANKTTRQFFRQILFFGLTVFICWSLALGALGQSTTPISFKILDQPIAPVSDRLFGHLLERASWGEPGPEIALEPGTRQLQPEAVDLMHQMNIPLIRFPGGTDVDYTNWQDLISNVPNRGTNRPLTTGHTSQVITNNFGLDEYFALRDELSAQKLSTRQQTNREIDSEKTDSEKTGNQETDSTAKVETILVVNFLDAVSGKVPLEAAAQNAAGLVAYANAPLDAALPAGMTDWPAIRAKNGHPEPFGAEYVQIGNEVWVGRFRGDVRKGKGLSNPEELAQWYTTCYQAYIAAIDAVDPNVALIIDGKMGDDIEKTVLADPVIRNRVQYLTYHDYAPGPISEVTKAGEPVDRDNLEPVDWWRALVAMPGWYDAESGTNLGQGNDIALAQSLNYQIAITEWNWNGWGFDEIALEDDINWRLASALGTAAYLHGLMRQGNDIKLACQSLLVGANWDITSIRVDADGKEPPYFWPQGQITAFYSRHHGSQLLEAISNNVPRYIQPFKIGWSRTPRGDIAAIDLVATADEKSIYIHAANRSFDRSLPITIDLSALPSIDATAMQYLFSEKEQPQQGWIQSMWQWLVHSRAREESSQAIAQIESQPQPLANQTLTVSLPKQSVSIFKIARDRSNGVSNSL